MVGEVTTEEKDEKDEDDDDGDDGDDRDPSLSLSLSPPMLRFISLLTLPSCAIIAPHQVKERKKKERRPPHTLSLVLCFVVRVSRASLFIHCPVRFYDAARDRKSVV